MSLPSIGAVGCISLLSPFDTLVNPNRQYKVISVRLIQDMVLVGERPLEEIYQPVGLGETEYRQDLDAGKSIVTFAGDGEELLYIPESYISSYPVSNGIYYQSKGLVFDLGPLPETYDLAPVLNMIKQEIKNLVGVNSEGRIVNTSAKTKISYTDHDTITSMRNANIAIPNTWFQRYNKLLNLVGNLNLTIADLECAVATGCCNNDCDNPGNFNPQEDVKMNYCFTSEFTYEQTEDLFVQQHMTGTPVDPGPTWNPTIPEDIFPDDPELFYVENGVCAGGNAEGLFFDNTP